MFWKPLLAYLCFSLVMVIRFANPALSKDFSDNWSATIPADAVGRGICSASTFGHVSPFSVCKSTLNTYLERKSLSENARLVFNIIVPATEPPCYVLVSHQGNATDVFYAEQTLHDCGPFPTYASANNAKGAWIIEGTGYQNEHNCSDLFFKLHPSLRNKVCVMHVIPTCVCDFYPDTFSESELHSDKNLVGIPVTKIQSQKLEDIRTDWFRYFKTHPKANRKDILTQASYIQKKYKSLFL